MKSAFHTQPSALSVALPALPFELGDPPVEIDQFTLDAVPVAAPGAMYGSAVALFSDFPSRRSGFIDEKAVDMASESQLSSEHAMSFNSTTTVLRKRFLLPYRAGRGM